MWKDEVKGQMFFSQTAISSCGIAIGYATMEQNL